MVGVGVVVARLRRELVATAVEDGEVFGVFGITHLESFGVLCWTACRCVLLDGVWGCFIGFRCCERGCRVVLGEE